MTKQREGMLHVKLKKESGKVIHVTPEEASLYRSFVGSLEEGQQVDVFFDANRDDGTLAQLAKAHKCVRMLASETGSGFEDLKIDLKKKAGLCIKKEIEGEMYMICKSLGKCSKDELALFIQACIEAGALVNIDLS